MCSMRSEDGFRDTHFFGGENKPRVVAQSHSCDDNGKYGSEKSIIFALVIVLASDKVYYFSRLHQLSLMAMSGQPSRVTLMTHLRHP
jgi:hypothetical protein